MQLDIWASLYSVQTLPSVALPDMDRTRLAQYVQEEQDTYANFAQAGARVLLRQDREFDQGGNQAVAAACAQIEQAFRQEMERLPAAGGTAEEVARLRGCEQQPGSVLELYHAGWTVKSRFDAVTKLYFLLL